ncbi:phosphopantetheine-binding protein [Nostoc sp. CCY 9925]|uniref:phosphopantetheine-binding protein n=1 Tax=Nostoc sp. CCY 9925 TaxID=3103865 RepID=UPI0039C6B465
MYDNFFELGGDSLLATQIFSRLKQAFFIDISLEKMLSYQSIAQLSEVIQNEIQPEEGKAKTHYYCSFEMKMGDEIITIYITEEEYRCQGLPDGAINFNIL